MTYEITILEIWDEDLMDSRHIVNSVGVVSGPELPNWQPFDLLVKLIKPIKYKDEIVHTLLIAPRNVGTTIDDIQRTECMVGIGRVLNGKEIIIGKRYSENDSVAWAIGIMKPVVA